MKKGILTVLLIAFIGTIIMGSYFIGIISAIFSTSVPRFFAYLIVFIALFIIGSFVYVAFERIKEIKEGKEDDISKY
ncbi:MULTISPECIES: hypothetical protein [Caloramator]|jgi:choline-glycine betaine transporter|uniref:Uncharacterized protein n=1 Tax=Caloramator australicus RC3 TaxID=857293 RepID=G0V3K8_9CLOT|nr:MULTISPECIES: hypothetical protein [Caloramator]WDU83275.1 hypothetical protein PWK10_00550 [Caloramator sp. Dgby_cultured_2]CCC57698.1 hypothetical protein CAAU_0048 [Caloramator australicus RC3]